MCNVVYRLGSMDPVNRESGYVELTLLLVVGFVVVAAVAGAADAVSSYRRSCRVIKARHALETRPTKMRKMQDALKGWQAEGRIDYQWCMFGFW